MDSRAETIPEPACDAGDTWWRTVHPPGQFAVAWYSLRALVSFAPGSWFFVRSWSFVLGALKKRATLQCGPWTRDQGRTTH